MELVFFALMVSSEFSIGTAIKLNKMLIIIIIKMMNQQNRMLVLILFVLMFIEIICGVVERNAFQLLLSQMSGIARTIVSPYANDHG